MPLWNPYLFAGVPFLAAGQHSALYPLSILYYVLPLDKAYGWFTVVNLALAGMFMFIFMRTLGLGRASSTFAGVAYQLSGFMIVSVVFPMIIAAAAWLPLILAMCERVIRQSPGAGRPPGVGAVGADRRARHRHDLLAGHVEIMVYTALITALYCAVAAGPRPAAREQPEHGRFVLIVRRAGWPSWPRSAWASPPSNSCRCSSWCRPASAPPARRSTQVLSYGFPVRARPAVADAELLRQPGAPRLLRSVQRGHQPVNTPSGHTDGASRTTSKAALTSASSRWSSRPWH